MKRILISLFIILNANVVFAQGKCDFVSAEKVLVRDTYKLKANITCTLNGSNSQNKFFYPNVEKTNILTIQQQIQDFIDQESKDTIAEDTIFNVYLRDKEGQTLSDIIDSYIGVLNINLNKYSVSSTEYIIERENKVITVSADGNHTYTDKQ